MEIQKSEMRLTALDEFIVKLKEGEKQMSNKKALPFCDMCGDEEFINRRKQNEENIGKAYNDIESIPKFVKIVANNSCFGAIDENGKMYIWGNNWAGQCDVPADLPPIQEFGIGYGHIAALDFNGKIHKWGKSDYGALDIPDNLPKMVSVIAASYKTVALSESGKVFSYSNTNQGSQEDVPKNMGFVTQISAGAYNTAALNKEGNVFTWGVFSSNPPAADVDFISIAATDYDIACLGADGKVYGDAKHSELNKRYKPKPEMTNIKKIFAGGENFAAIDGDGKLYIWGQYAKMVDGYSIMDIPFNLPPVTEVAFGYCEILCLGVDGKLYGWGITDVVVPPKFDGFENGPVFEPQPIVDITVPRDVYTFEELLQAVQERVQNITVKADMIIPDSEVIHKNGMTHKISNNFYLMNEINLTVAEGVAFTVDCGNFFIQNKLINYGIIKGTGRIGVNNPIEGTGKVISGKVKERVRITTGLGVELYGIEPDEISKYLAEDSFYTNLNFRYSENVVIEIKNDLLIPKGKAVWMDMQCILKVNESVTLTIEGILETSQEPIIEGKVIGELSNIFNQAERDVYTYEELCEATHQNVESGKPYRHHGKVTIKADMIINGSFKVNQHISTILIIDEGVTLTVNSPDFTIFNNFINNGTINGTGHVYVNAPIGGTGNVNTPVSLIDPETDELNEYLAEDSIYTSVIYLNIEEGGYEKTMFFLKRDDLKSFVTIDKDLVIVEGKSLWLHANCTLKVREGATVKIDGKLETYNEPVINGTVIGDITVIDSETPRDVYTFEDFYLAGRDMVKDITVKESMDVKIRDFIQMDNLIIEEGVTLNVNSSIGVLKKLINKGMINVKGRLNVYSRIEGEERIMGSEIAISGITADEIGTYLAEYTIYTNAFLMTKEESIYEITSDLTIPEGKELWLNYYCTLKVCEGATLTIHGKVETYNEPIIEGSVVGKFDMKEKFPF